VGGVVGAGAVGFPRGFGVLRGSVLASAASAFLGRTCSATLRIRAVPQATRDLAADHFSWTAAPPMAVKGKSQPVPTFVPSPVRATATG
jgi:class 3 adenylate cyclase